MANRNKRTSSPLDQMNFQVVSAGLTNELTFGITAVRGIKRSVGNIEYRASGDSSLVKENHPGLITIEPVTLSGGIVFNLNELEILKQWQETVVEGKGSSNYNRVTFTIKPTVNYVNPDESFDGKKIQLMNCEPRELTITDFDTNATGFIRFELVVRPQDIKFV